MLAATPPIFKLGQYLNYVILEKIAIARWGNAARTLSTSVGRRSASEGSERLHQIPECHDSGGAAKSDLNRFWKEPTSDD